MDDKAIEMLQTHHVINAVMIYRERGVIKAIEYLRDRGVSFEVAISVLAMVDNAMDLLRQDRELP